MTPYTRRTERQGSQQSARATLLLSVLLIGLFGVACGQSQTPEPRPIDVTITLDDVSPLAWVVTSVEGAEGIAELDTENTPIQLTVGQRYRFVNLGTRTVHPLALRGEDGEPLLDQRPQDRPFETDPEVAFEADDEGITFTLTGALAAQLSTYYCTAHPAPLMEAPLEISSP